MLGIRGLKQRKRLAQGTECALDAGFAVYLGRRILGFKKRTDRPRDVVRDSQHFLWDVCLLLERFERLPESLTSLSRFCIR